MDERTERRILEKADYVGEAVTVLAEVRDETTFEEYRTDRRQRDVVEREFQTAIEACIDIGSMYLSASDATVPDRNADVFRELQSRGVLDDELTERLTRAAGFRNVLAHRYGTEIDDEDVYNVLEQELDLFGAFLKQIRAELD